MTRIVVFGATGYTGRLTAAALVARGARPVLAGRDPAKLARVAADSGGLETAVADVSRPDTVRALVGAGDVLVTTVGPFARYGAPAVEAALDAGAHYVDSTGEAPFVREVFESYADRAQRSALLTAMGYDYVPGNLAGALALRVAPEATRVDVGYFQSGGGGMSSGTRASAAGVVLAPQHSFRGGRLRSEPSARHVRSFPVGGRSLPAASSGGTEPYTLPRLSPALTEVGVYLGWFGAATRPLQALSLGFSALRRLPGAGALLDAAVRPPGDAATGTGPSAEVRARRRSRVVALACDDGGRQLASVEVAGVDGYDFTAGMLAWAAEQLAAGVVRGTGALGPVDAFGLEALERGCAEAGLRAV